MEQVVVRRSWTRYKLCKRKYGAFLHDLMPPIFKYASLSEILQDYVYQHNQPGQTELELLLEPEDNFDNLSQKVSLEIYRIVQEAVGNSLKHAQATLVKIILVREDNKVKLTVSDNGRGFEQQTGKDGNWSYYHKRACGKPEGNSDFELCSGKGTELIVEIDLENLENKREITVCLPPIT